MQQKCQVTFQRKLKIKASGAASSLSFSETNRLTIDAGQKARI